MACLGGRPLEKIEVGAFFGFPACPWDAAGHVLALHGFRIAGLALHQITISSSLIACCPLIDVAPALFGRNMPNRSSVLH